jgi:hypothetical protein
VLQIMHPWLQSEPGQKETQLVDEQCRIHPWISNLFANIMVTHGLQNLEMKEYIRKLWNISWSIKSSSSQILKSASMQSPGPQIILQSHSFKT